LEPKPPHIKISDPIENRRMNSARSVRIIYGLSILGLVFFLLWYFARFTFFLEGTGRVSAKDYFLSEPYNVKIKNIYVVPGTNVEAGDVLAEFESFQVDQYITDILKAITEQTTKEADLKIRLATAIASKTTGFKRSDFAAESVRKMERLPQGLFSNQDRIPFYREQAMAKKDASTVSAEIDEITKQLEILSNNRQMLHDRIDKIRKDFQNGQILAPIDGIIGARLANTGATVIAGEVIAEVFDKKDIYIDWEIPLGRFIEPKVGDPVFIVSGFATMEGKISDIYPISTKLGENQKEVFSSAPQGQTARIRVDHPEKLEKFAIDSLVTIRMNYNTILDDLFRFFMGWFAKS